MGTPTVFVISADAAVSDSVKALTDSVGLQSEVFASLPAFLGAVGPERRGCLVISIDADDVRDDDRRARLTAACAQLPSILISDFGDVPTAVGALKAGARDVVQRPYQDENLLATIQKALQTARNAHH